MPVIWGHSLVDALQPADLTVEKVAYSAFYQTRMEFVLSRAGIRTLMVCGIVTNGGVASTVRDAHVSDFNTITLHEGCAAFSPDTHDTAIKALASVGKTMSIAEARRCSLEVARHAICDYQRQHRRRIEVDCLIIGGAAGLTAALAASEAGRACLSPSAITLSGSTALSSGLIPAAGTKAQSGPVHFVQRRHFLR